MMSEKIAWNRLSHRWLDSLLDRPVREYVEARNCE